MLLRAANISLRPVLFVIHFRFCPKSFCIVRFLLPSTTWQLQLHSLLASQLLMKPKLCATSCPRPLAGILIEPLLFLCTSIWMPHRPPLTMNNHRHISDGHTQIFTIERSYWQRPSENVGLERQIGLQFSYRTVPNGLSHFGRRCCLAFAWSSSSHARQQTRLSFAI